MSPYLEVVVKKSELAGIKGKDLFPYIRKLTAARGLIYHDPQAPIRRG